MEKNYQCVLCGHYFENAPRRPEQCPDCGCKQIRDVERGNMDSVNPASVAHLKRKMESCPNYDTDPKTGAQSYHKLDLAREIDVSKANLKLKPEVAAVTIRDKCSHCGILYGQAIVPLSRPDVLERMGILHEVESKIPGWRPNE